MLCRVFTLRRGGTGLILEGARVSLVPLAWHQAQRRGVG
jgi:hypothetical protein